MQPRWKLVNDEFQNFGAFILTFYRFHSVLGYYNFEHQVEDFVDTVLKLGLHNKVNPVNFENEEFLEYDESRFKDELNNLAVKIIDTDKQTEIVGRISSLALINSKFYDTSNLEFIELVIGNLNETEAIDSIDLNLNSNKLEVYASIIPSV